MPRITNLAWEVLECIFMKDGFEFSRQKGDHRAYSKAGIIRPLIIPTYKSVRLDIITSLMRTANMNRERYFELLAQC
jgi:predicted RNA binding protein YcfA (HicA-like mRNA interferase family)